MGLSREARIITLLVIDSAFFFLEIIVGYAVGSLALVADSFHMLNDVMSLVVALYALKLSKKDSTSDSRYSYGWQRAEILGALVNGVFLLALCFSIFMEAIERFVNVTEVSNPRLVIIVGSLGLASNIVGLFLFHDHGHSHGGHSHSHGSHSHGAESHDHAHSHDIEPAHDSSVSASATAIPSNGKSKQRSSSVDQEVGSLYGHPAQTRAYVVQTAQDMGYERQGKSVAIQGGERDTLNPAASSSNGYGTMDRDVEADADAANDDLPSAETAIAHRLPGSNKAKKDHSHGGAGGHSHGGGHGHSHDGSMNMQGVFLHVLGDALGNVGVILAGVFIATTSYWWRFYSDPLISFIITIIIFHSALPLVKSASFILLQGVPSGVPLEQVKEAMHNVRGVLSVHELHIWQLSESKIVASVHVLVDCSTGQEQRYMEIAADLRRLLHAYGIHSSTIQPEFVAGGMAEAARISGVEVAETDGGKGGSSAPKTDSEGRLMTKDGSLVEHALSRAPSSCLLACDEECGPDEACCPPPPQQQQVAKSDDGHNHGHEGHNH
ncbi:cation efflux protein [Jaminaea rosea]|uniref:Cation efflux protein n=1 Tax=Jaminaea rosea TaxID=1569628 RepID=A0A316UTN6_9BASI|nr:cation efflux protein [Jaminaea rosea]PWN28168.1 cation efflux protein [Jaminaea rosea]